MRATSRHVWQGVSAASRHAKGSRCRLRWRRFLQPQAISLIKLWSASDGGTTAAKSAYRYPKCCHVESAMLIADVALAAAVMTTVVTVLWRVVKSANDASTIPPSLLLFDMVLWLEIRRSSNFHKSRRLSVIVPNPSLSTTVTMVSLSKSCVKLVRQLSARCTGTFTMRNNCHPRNWHWDTTRTITAFLTHADAIIIVICSILWDNFQWMALFSFLNIILPAVPSYYFP